MAALLRQSIAAHDEEVYVLDNGTWNDLFLQRHREDVRGQMRPVDGGVDFPPYVVVVSPPELLASRLAIFPLLALQTLELAYDGRAVISIAVEEIQGSHFRVYVAGRDKEVAPEGTLVARRAGMGYECAFGGREGLGAYISGTLARLACFQGNLPDKSEEAEELLCEVLRRNGDREGGTIQEHAAWLAIERVRLLYAERAEQGRRRGKEQVRVNVPGMAVVCGPLLRYDTVLEGVWHGYCMVVTSDSRSTIEHTGPLLEARWLDEHSHQRVYMTTHADRIYRYTGDGQEKYSFWRWKIEVPLGHCESRVSYSINGGEDISFWVPSRTQDMRWIAFSCNGFSQKVDQAAFHGPVLWKDVLRRHEEAPYHVMIGGGDQLYADCVVDEPELQEWIQDKSFKRKMHMRATPEIQAGIDRFLFHRYCEWFSTPPYAYALRQIPQVNVIDDHDLIDGFGSYPDDLQRSPIFSMIGSRGMFFALLFQMFVCDQHDGLSHVRGEHSNSSLIIGGPGSYVPLPNHSWLTYLGPSLFILLLDCRTERRVDQICSPKTYNRVFRAIRKLPAPVKHLIVLTGVPVAYPRMNALERVLHTKMLPTSFIGNRRLFGLHLTNSFNGDPEILDDLIDHWTASDHLRERDWLVTELQNIALKQRIRISYFAGDVHCASVQMFRGKDGTVAPEDDHRFSLQIVSSAISNAPPPAAVLHYTNFQSKGRRKVDALTEERSVPIFDHDTDGSPHSTPCVMGRRNYVSGSVNNHGDLIFDVRVEALKGAPTGATKGYSVSAPQPAW